MIIIHSIVSTLNNINTLMQNNMDKVPYLIHIYTLISVCPEARNQGVISKTTHFSQKSWLKVKAFMSESTE